MEGRGVADPTYRRGVKGQGSSGATQNRSEGERALTHLEREASALASPICDPVFFHGAFLMRRRADAL